MRRGRPLGHTRWVRHVNCSVRERAIAARRCRAPREDAPAVPEPRHRTAIRGLVSACSECTLANGCQGRAGADSVKLFFVRFTRSGSTRPILEEVLQNSKCHKMHVLTETVIVAIVARELYDPSGPSNRQELLAYDPVEPDWLTYHTAQAPTMSRATAQIPTQTRGAALILSLSTNFQRPHRPESEPSCEPPL